MGSWNSGEHLDSSLALEVVHAEVVFTIREKMRWSWRSHQLRLEPQECSKFKEQAVKEVPAKKTINKPRTGRTEFVLQKKAFLSVAHIVLRILVLIHFSAINFLICFGS